MLSKSLYLIRMLLKSLRMYRAVCSQWSLLYYCFCLVGFQDAFSSNLLNSNRTARNVEFGSAAWSCIWLNSLGVPGTVELESFSALSPTKEAPEFSAQRPVTFISLVSLSSCQSVLLDYLHGRDCEIQVWLLGLLAVGAGVKLPTPTLRRTQSVQLQIWCT